MKKSRKKEKKALSNTSQTRGFISSNEINSPIDIPMPYGPNLGLRPMEYLISQQLYELETGFKDLCEEFFSKANPDEFNSSYMDAIIERICIEAIKYIKAQRRDHERLIKNELDIMHNGDYVDAKCKLQYYLDDREKNEKELKKYRRIYYSGTSLEEEV